MFLIILLNHLPANSQRASAPELPFHQRIHDLVDYMPQSQYQVPYKKASYTLVRWMQFYFKIVSELRTENCSKPARWNYLIFDITGPK